MKILSLTTSGFRGLPDGEYLFSSPPGEPHNLVLVTSAPGSGKSALLQAILAVKEAVGAYEFRKANPCVAPGRVVAELEARWHLEPQEAALAGSSKVVATCVVFSADGVAVGDHPPPLRDLFATFSREPARPKVLLFHDDRVLPPTRGIRHSLHEPSESADGHLQISRSVDKYNVVRPYIVRTLLADALSRAQGDGIAPQVAGEGALQRLRDLFRPFLADAVFDGISPDGRGYMVRFRRRDGSVVDLDDLAACERQGVLFAATMARCGVDSSLVLVDEPELHIHSGARVRFLEALAALGRDNQIIAATGAAELVSADRGHVIDLSRLAPARAPSADPASPTAGPARLEPATLPEPTRAEPPAPYNVPSFLHAAQVGGAVGLPSAPVLFPPPAADEEDGHGTVELEGVTIGPALPFVQPPHAGAWPHGSPAGPPSVRGAEPERRAPSPAAADGYGTAMIKNVVSGPALPFAQRGAPRSPATGALPAFQAGPPGKRLVRFDPQTGKPLPEPIWVDMPDPGKREP